MKYYIFVCPKCKKQISEEDMGKKCPHCKEWQYHMLAQKECVILEGEICNCADDGCSKEHKVEDTWTVEMSTNGGKTFSSKPLKGTFMWAVEQMKQGKKVRNPNLGEYNQWFMKEHQYADGEELSIFSTNGNVHVCPSINNYESTDWEIYEEEFNLEKKIQKIKVDFNAVCMLERPGDGLKDMWNQIEKAIKRAREIK